MLCVSFLHVLNYHDPIVHFVPEGHPAIQTEDDDSYVRKVRIIEPYNQE